jgi:VCBS repeat protein
MVQDLSCRGRLLAPALCIAAALGLIQAGCGQPAPAKTGAEARDASPSAAAPAAAAPGAAPTSDTAKAAAASAPEPPPESTTDQGADQESDQEPVEVIPVKPVDVNRDVVPFEGPIPFEPPDGRWRKDEYGRPYFVHKIAKIPGAYHWEVEGKRVLLPRGLMFDVVAHDEKTFSVKIYGTPPEWIEQQQGSREPSPEDLARVAATYQADVASADRLRFVPFNRGLPARAQWRQGFAVADINKDGQLDIVHGPPRKGGSRPAIFLGDGKGGWRIWSEAAFPPVPFDYGDAAVGDLNRDGHPDLVLASHLRGITAMLGDGRGRFRPWSEGIEFQQSTDAPPAFSSRQVELADWNGDGRLDIVALGEGPRLAVTRIQARDFTRGARGVVVYLNQGDGTWQKKTQEDVVYGDSLVVADFDGDRRLDFATASAVAGNRTLLRHGGKDGSWQGTPIEALRPQATFRSVAAGDFDRDGRLDLAVGYTSNELGVTRTGLDVLLARAGGGWERRTLGAEEGNAGIWSLDAGDLDGDGALDLVGLTGMGLGWVFLGDGKGSFTREASPEMATPDAGCTGYHLELADLDKDGAAEVIAGFAGEGGGLPGMGGAPRCLTGGSLQAWKVTKVER